MKKLSNTEAELKKSVAYQKKRVVGWVENFLMKCITSKSQATTLVKLHYEMFHEKRLKLELEKFLLTSSSKISNILLSSPV